MALSQSAFLDLLDALNASDGVDVILLVHWEEMSAEESEHAGTALIMDIKQRSGGQGEVRVLFKGERVGMVDMESRYEDYSAA